MERFTGAIRSALASSNWYAALFIAVSMPDVCGSISDAAGRASQKAYKDWFDKYLAQGYRRCIGPYKEEHVFLSASDCYALRCAVLHNATDDLTGQQAKESLSRFSFSTLQSHCNQINDVLCLNVKNFCEDVISAVEQWYESVAKDAEVMKRMRSLVFIHEEPYYPVEGVMYG